MIDLTFSPDPGTYEGQVDVTITAVPLGATIFYSINGTIPTEYTGPVTLTSDTVLTAFATSTLPDNSPFYSWEYLVTEVADSDEDTIPDTIEGDGDADFDGTPDSLDIDSDNDELLDEEEVGPDPLNPVDTDGDTIPDFQDFDSDNDGIADIIEGDRDSNLNSIPDYIDPNLTTEMVIYFDNLPDEREMVENVVYPVRIMVHSGSGTLDISKVNDAILGIDETLGGEPLTIIAGDMLEFDIMYTADYGGFGESGLYFYLKDDLLPEDLTTVFKLCKPVTEDADYPLFGNKVKWSKVDGVNKYRIYKKLPEEADYSILIDLPADPSSNSNYQWYLDREVNPLAKYSAVAVDDEGVEGERTLPRHSGAVSIPKCLVQGHLLSVAGAPLEECQIFVRIKEYPQRIGGALLSRFSDLYVTDANGYFEFEVPQGTIIVLHVPDAELKKDLIIPYESSLDLAELLDHPQNR